MQEDRNGLRFNTAMPFILNTVKFTPIILIRYNQGISIIKCFPEQSYRLSGHPLHLVGLAF